MQMKDFVKIEQLEDVVTQMNNVFKLLEARIEKLEAEKPKTISRKPAKKEPSDG